MHSVDSMILPESVQAKNLDEQTSFSARWNFPIATMQPASSSLRTIAVLWPLYSTAAKAQTSDAAMTSPPALT
eukprot:6085085-Amphidinium_carterae.1